MKFVKHNNGKIYVAFFDEDEAIRLIKSIALQMMTKSTAGIEAFQTDKGETLTITVQSKKEEG